MNDLERLRAERAAVTLTTTQIARGTLAIAGVLSRYAGSVPATDVARNIAGSIGLLLAIGDEVIVAEIIRESLEGRRKNWPETVWGLLTDEGIAMFAAEGAARWERAIRAARAA